MGEPGTDQSAIFHITHWKAGSQWVSGVLTRLLPDRHVPIKGLKPEVLEAALRPGGLYTPIYMNGRRFRKVVGTLPHRRVVVIRDLRDTLVSWYFSLRYSHPVNAFVSGQRSQFESMPAEEALASLVDGKLAQIADLQKSWADDEGLVRYEELVADEQGAFRRIARHLGIDADDDVLQRVVAANSFESRTGRSRGEEDATSHRRKGIAGDWRNHFTARVKDVFKERYGQHLIEMGYETNLDW